MVAVEKNNKVLSLLRKLKIVPVVSIPSVEAGLQLGQLLVDCDLPIIEVTFRTPCAAEAIKEIKKKFTNLTLLAGTVLSPEQADIAWEAGAECIIIPGLEQKLVEHCINKEMVVCPGTATPSEVLQCRSMGLKLVKFFPAELAGGIDMLKALSSVYSDMLFMPTGGINMENLLAYQALDSVTCCGGSWLAPEQMMREGQWSAIKDRIIAAREILALSDFHKIDNSCFTKQVMGTKGDLAMAK